MLRQLRNYLALVTRIWQAPGNRGHRASRLLRSIAWLINKKTLRRPWTVPVYTGPDLPLNLRLRCHPGSIIALHVVQRSEWHDWDTARFIAHFLREGDTFIDVGANIGLYTLPAARIVGDAGTVIAVEPSPINRARLQENLTLNGIATVHVEACAIGAETGELLFNDDDALAHLEPASVPPFAPSAASASHSSQLPGGSEPPSSLAATSHCLVVPIQTLPSILPDRVSEVTLLKVDVEGFELGVFRGALPAMQAGRLPVILFEMNHSHDRYGVTSHDILTFLRSAGYEIARYDHDARRLLHDRLEGDLIAHTPHGLALIQRRLSAR